MKKDSFRLFTVLPSFLLGMASAIDIGATLSIYKNDRTPEEADSKAIESDWHAIGDCLYDSRDKFKAQNVY